MELNYFICLAAGIIPLAVGALYYSPMLFGNSWMKLNGFTEEQLKEGNPFILFGSSYLFSVLIALAMSGIVIHQTGMMQTLVMEPDFAKEGTELNNYFKDFMANYGNLHRNFGHGVLHGVLFTILFAFPLIGINSLFERRGWKYIFIHTGYWLVTLALMGGVLCQFM